MKSLYSQPTPFPRLWQFRPLRLKVVCDLAWSWRLWNRPAVDVPVTSCRNGRRSSRFSRPPCMFLPRGTKNRLAESN